MTIEIKIPDIGTDEVEVTEILVKVGDKVEPEQSLIIVEGDKVSMEIPSPQAGIVKEIKVSVGDKTKTGKLSMIFDSPDNEIVPAVKENEKNAVTTLDTVLPNSDKASPDVIRQPVLFHRKNDEEFKYNENCIYIHATPLVRRLAREFGINLAKVKGTGRKGRILREDIQSYIKDTIKLAESVHSTQNITTSNATSSSIPPWPNIDFSKFGLIEELKLSRIQKTSGANLSRNWAMIPHVTHFDKTDITDLDAFRKQQNTEAEKRKLGLKFTPVVFIMKAVASALEKMPRFNSSLSEDGHTLILKKYINIGVAVDTSNGLLVPVFKDVNKKNITSLSYELAALSKKARDGKLTANEMQGGCFTISSIGALGTTYFSPIINAPEVAILGISKSVIEAIWNGKEFIPRLMMPISLSFDHRVIDGADGARFITIINNILSDIRCLLM